jgi:hypothetical protein
LWRQDDHQVGQVAKPLERLPAHIGRRPVAVTARSSRPFTGGGFAGTVDATVTLAVRRVPLKR